MSSVAKLVLTAFMVIQSLPALADSLWDSQRGDQVESLYSDHRASKIGDIITVMVVDSTTVSQKASSERDKKSTIAGQVKNWSLPMFFHGMRTKVDNASNLPVWDVETANKHSGSGTYSGNYALRGQITTRIIEVLSNKNLVVEGTSEVWINKEKNKISVSGIVRPEDITTENTVLSNQLADARVEILGKGPLNDKTNRGFFEGMLDWIWPF